MEAERFEDAGALFSTLLQDDPENPAAVGGYMYRAEQELRSQTAGIGIDVVRLPDGILVRVPAVMTFDPGSAAIKPQIDATLTEVARTLKTFNQTYVDVLAHSDTSGTRQSGAIAEAGQRSGGLPRWSRCRPGENCVAWPRRIRPALQSGVRRGAEGGQPPGRNPADPVSRLANVAAQKRRGAARPILPRRCRRARRAGDGRWAGQTPWPRESRRRLSDHPLQSAAP